MHNGDPGNPVRIRHGSNVNSIERDLGGERIEGGRRRDRPAKKRGIRREGGGGGGGQEEEKLKPAKDTREARERGGI